MQEFAFVVRLKINSSKPIDEKELVDLLSYEFWYNQDGIEIVDEEVLSLVAKDNKPKENV